jgi:MEMO1 family protein
LSKRAAKFAGSWYQGSKSALLAQIDDLLPGNVETGKAIGIVAPHAGYIYSGSTAGQVYARVEVPDRVVVLCVNHKGAGAPLAVWTEGSWDTPLGALAIDSAAAALLLAECPGTEADEAAHALEHSLELQLPFIKRRNPNASILPVSVGTHDPGALRSMGEAVAAVVKRSAGETLIVASSDMTHFEPAVTAKQRDEMALERVRALDPEGLLAVVARERISMCGAAPTAAMLWAARELGATTCELVDYSHSGMVTGDDADVVAYAGLIVT